MQRARIALCDPFHDLAHGHALPRQGILIGPLLKRLLQCDLACAATVRMFVTSPDRCARDSSTTLESTEPSDCTCERSTISSRKSPPAKGIGPHVFRTCSRLLHLLTASAPAHGSSCAHRCQSAMSAFTVGVEGEADFAEAAFLIHSYRWRFIRGYR